GHAAHGRRRHHILTVHSRSTPLMGATRAPHSELQELPHPKDPEEPGRKRARAPMVEFSPPTPRQFLRGNPNRAARLLARVLALYAVELHLRLECRPWHAC